MYKTSDGEWYKARLPSGEIVWVAAAYIAAEADVETIPTVSADGIPTLPPPTSTPTALPTPTATPSLADVREEVLEELDDRTLLFSDTEVSVVNGRPTGGEKAILIKYNTHWQYDGEYYWEDVGGCFGAAGEAMLKLDPDFDVVIVVIGDHETKKYLESYLIDASVLVAFQKGQVSAEEFVNSIHVIDPSSIP